MAYPTTGQVYSVKPLSGGLDNGERPSTPSGKKSPGKLNNGSSAATVHPEKLDRTWSSALISADDADGTPEGNAKKKQPAR